MVKVNKRFEGSNRIFVGTSIKIKSWISNIKWSMLEQELLRKAGLRKKTCLIVIRYDLFSFWEKLVPANIL